MGTKSGAHCHKLVAKTAQENTRLLYEALMQNDAIWREWKRQHPGASSRGLEEAFVKKYWPRAVEPARATLAALLRQPLSEALKNEISEALILDATLKKGREAGVRQIGLTKP